MRQILETARKLLYPAGVATALAGCVGGEAGDSIDAMPRIEIDETLRIGSLDDPDIGFSSIGGVAVDSDGYIYVFDRQDTAIRVYDSTGSLLTRLGANGQGPGEFRYLSEIGLINDTLWTGDFELRRISFFTRTDGFIRSVAQQTAPMELPGLVGAQWLTKGPRADGLFDATWLIPIPLEPPADSFWIHHVRMDSAGAVVDTVQRQRYALTRSERLEIGGVRVTVPSGPSDYPLWIDAGDNAWIVERPVAGTPDTGMFTVTHIAGIADTLFTDTLSYTPVPFSGADADKVIEDRVARYADREGIDVDVLRARISSAFEPPARHPPFRSGRTGSDGTLWLLSQDAGEPDDDWLVFSPEGEPVGVVSLPAGTTIHWSDASTIWASVRGEFDVPWLVRYKLRNATAR